MELESGLKSIEISEHAGFVMADVTNHHQYSI
jgi:hypothetical protein